MISLIASAKTQIINTVFDVFMATNAQISPTAIRASVAIIFVLIVMLPQSTLSFPPNEEILKNVFIAAGDIRASVATLFCINSYTPTTDPKLSTE